MPRPGNSWACSTNIFTLLAGKPCPGCTKSTVLPLLPMCGPPSHYLYQQTQDYTEICNKVRHGPLVPRLSGPHPNYELASSCLLHAENGRKLLLYKHILLGGSIIPPSVLTPHPHPSPRLHQCMALYRPITKTSAHLHSFFPSVVTLWNKLSSDLISANSQAMLNHHLNQVVL